MGKRALCFKISGAKSQKYKNRVKSSLQSKTRAETPTAQLNNFNADDSI
jgi:hypothetical protein